MNNLTTQNSWLRQLRQEANVTQEVLAVRLGVSLSTLRQWDQGKAEPTLTWRQWEDLSEALNVPLSQLYVRISEVASEVA